MNDINRVQSESTVSAVGSSYDINKIISIDMDMFPPTQAFQGYLSLIVVQLSSINACSKITLRVCRDSLGDQMIITDTDSDIFTGITTATKGTCVFALNGFVKLASGGHLHCFAKTDTGSCDIDFIEMVYQGER